MPHYMFQGRYSAASLKAMVDTPQDREVQARKIVEAAGGKLLQFFFCFGEDDFVVLIEGPDDASIAAVTFTIGASGGFSAGRTTKLMTAQEAMKSMAKAKAMSSSYAPPKA